jgi:hypothetical protein
VTASATAQRYAAEGSAGTDGQPASSLKPQVPGPGWDVDSTHLSKLPASRIAICFALLSDEYALW